MTSEEKRVLLSVLKDIQNLKYGLGITLTDMESSVFRRIERQLKTLLGEQK